MSTTSKKAAKTVTKRPILNKNGQKMVKKASPTKKAVSKPVPPKAAVKKPAPKKAAPKKQAPAKKVLPSRLTKPVAKLPHPIKKVAQLKKTVKVEVKKPAPKVVKPVEKPIAKKLNGKVEGKKPELKPMVSAKDIKIPAPKPVVLPKITTTKSRKYEPEFTRSVLDQLKEDNTGPTHRYSDNELNEFRELIQRKLETAKKELGYLQGLITRKDEMGGDDTDNRYMTMEDGSLSMEREQLSQMASRQITFIDHLEKAMMRIENKTYGICRVTGKLIDKARLRAVPHATLSIEAKMGIVK